MDDNTFWQFMTRGKNGQITMKNPLKELEYLWKMCLQEKTFEVRWQNGIARQIHGFGQHVLAASLQNTQALSNISKALRPSNPD